MNENLKKLTGLYKNLKARLQEEMEEQLNAFGEQIEKKILEGGYTRKEVEEALREIARG